MKEIFINFFSPAFALLCYKNSIKILKSITLLNTVETHSACSAAVLRRTSPRPEESTSMVPLTLVRGRPCASNRSSGLPSPADSLLHTAILGAIDGSKRSSCGCRPNMSNMLQSCSTTGIPFWSQFISSLPTDKLTVVADTPDYLTVVVRGMWRMKKLKLVDRLQ